MVEAFSSLYSWTKAPNSQSDMLPTTYCLVNDMVLKYGDTDNYILDIVCIAEQISGHRQNKDPMCDSCSLYIVMLLGKHSYRGSNKSWYWNLDPLLTSTLRGMHFPLGWTRLYPIIPWDILGVQNIHHPLCMQLSYQ